MVDVAGVPRFPELDEYPVDIAMLQNGWRPTGGVVNPAADQGLLNWPLRDLTYRTNYLYRRHLERQLGASMTLTVGPGGEYATLNAALKRLSLMTPLLQPTPVIATVRLLAGYEMAEQVFVRGINLGWVNIVSDNAVVLIHRDALTQASGELFPAFLASDGGILPRISVLFTMTTAGPAIYRSGVAVTNGGLSVFSAGAGVQGAGYYGCYAELGGSISVEGGDFRNAGQDGVRASRGGLISVINGNLSGAGAAAVVCHRSSRVDCAEANLTGATTYGIFAQRAGMVNAWGAQCRRSAGVDGSNDIYVSQGGIISAHTAVGGTSVAVNTATTAGIIFR